jgi:hypothetical protein
MATIAWMRPLSSNYQGRLEEVGGHGVTELPGDGDRTAALVTDVLRRPEEEVGLGAEVAIVVLAGEEQQGYTIRREDSLR